MSIPAAVTTATSEFREKEFERIQTLDGALPFIGAAGVDAIFHSIPGLNLVFGLLAEPVGAAAGGCRSTVVLVLFRWGFCMAISVEQVRNKCAARLA